MRTVRIIAFIVMGLALIPFAASAFLPVNGSSLYWTIASVLALGGGAIGVGTVAWNHLPDNKLVIKKEDIMDKDVKDNPKNNEVEPTKSELQEKDTKDLYYLSERANKLGDKVAVALCRELQDRFFCLHHGIDPCEDVNEKTNTSPSPNPTS